MGPVNYFTGHHSNTISSGAVKFYLVNKNKSIWRYMEAILLHTCAPTVYLGDNTSCISVVEPKRVTPRVKHIKIAVRFLQ